MDKPQRVTFPPGVHIKQASIGGWHCLALDDSGQCWAWGEPGGGGEGAEAAAVEAEAGLNVSAAALEQAPPCPARRLSDALSHSPLCTALVSCAAGGNEYGQCLPRDKRDILSPVRCLRGMRVKQVAAGGMHSLALTESGEVRAPGRRGISLREAGLPAPLGARAGVGLARVPPPCVDYVCLARPSRIACPSLTLPSTDLLLGRALGRLFDDHQPRAPPHRHHR